MHSYTPYITNVNNIQIPQQSVIPSMTRLQKLLFI